MFDVIWWDDDHLCKNAFVQNIFRLNGELNGQIRIDFSGSLVADFWPHPDSCQIMVYLYVGESISELGSDHMEVSQSGGSPKSSVISRTIHEINQPAIGGSICGGRTKAMYQNNPEHIFDDIHIYIYIHTRIICIYIYIHTYIHIYIHTYMYTDILSVLYCTGHAAALSPTWSLLQGFLARVL